MAENSWYEEIASLSPYVLPAGFPTLCSFFLDVGFPTFTCNVSCCTSGSRRLDTTYNVYKSATRHNFWGPFVKRFALCYRTVVLSVSPVCDVVVLWPNSWMDYNATWYGGRPRPRPHCVTWKRSSPTADPPLFGPCLLWPNCRALVWDMRQTHGHWSQYSHPPGGELTRACCARLPRLVRLCHRPRRDGYYTIAAIILLECGPMPNVMAALPILCGALCSTPHSLADAHYLTAVQ